LVKKKEVLKSTRQFIKEDIWKINPGQHPRYFLIRQLKIAIMAFKGFTENHIQLRASALTFYSLLSVVPVVAMIFGIAKGFGLDSTLESEIIEKFKGQEEVMKWILSFAKNFLENSNGGIIAGVGLVVLFWTVMKVLGNIEDSFNHIWQIRHPRPLVRKFTDYLSIMLFAPILMVLSSSVTVFITTQIQTITEAVPLLGKIGPVIYFGMGLLPYALVWLVFTLIYIVMPNTRVTFRSAFIAGVIAGTIFQVVQWGYIHFQMNMNSYSAVYGTFAALPLFLVWLQLSWLIVLFGAEISFANQNVEKYEYETESLHISHYYRQILSLYIAHFVVKNFAEGREPMTAQQIAHALEMPVKIARDILYELVGCRIFAETVTDSPKTNAYQPARDISTITVRYVLQKLEKSGLENIHVATTRELQAITSIQDSFLKLLEKAPENQLLKDI
jgi:membrane protein